MSSLSHEQAQEIIQRGYLAEQDRLALQQHLSSCEECRAYAAMHVLLWRDMPLRAPRKMPTAAQREAVMARASGKRMAPPLWRPLSALGGVAAVMFMALAFWLALSAANATTSQPQLPPPLATVLAPVLPQATPDPRGRYVIDTVPAPSLAGNVIGEPLEQQVVVYLPPSYDGSDRRYPVVYALVSDQDSFTEIEWLGSHIRSGMNLALSDGGAQEMIVVAPNVMNTLNLTNQFVNSPVTGNWESYIVTDLVGYIDAHYRTQPGAGSRGLLGEWIHGLDALMIAVRHADIFGAVYLQRPFVLAPGALEETPMVSSLTQSGAIELIDELATLPHDAALRRIKERFEAGNSYLPALRFVFPYGMSFAPTADAGPPFLEYPFAVADGSPAPEIWQKWESGLGNIPEKLQSGRVALLTLDIALSSYEGDTYLTDQLTVAGIPHAFSSQSEASVLEELGNEIFPFFSEALNFD